jgi:hypothetical protein
MLPLPSHGRVSVKQRERYNLEENREGAAGRAFPAARGVRPFAAALPVRKHSAEAWRVYGDSAANR